MHSHGFPGARAGLDQVRRRGQLIRGHQQLEREASSAHGAHVARTPAITAGSAAV
ncbi:MAG: hypothetical protein ACRDPD_11005 [Streptosporangiaceae bacterium]